MHAKTTSHATTDQAADLLAARKAAGLSQAEAAKLMGISPRHLWKIEHGVTKLPHYHEVTTWEGCIGKLRKAAPKAAPAA